LRQTPFATANQGFTIMEVALASTVLALTLVGMIGVVESGSQMLDLSRKQTIASQILHGEIDQLRLQSWQTISGYTSANVASTTFGYGASTSLTTGNDTFFAIYNTMYPNAQRIFTLTRTVACIQPSANPNLNSTGIHYSTPPLLLQVTFTITWNGVTGRPYSRTATTFVGFNGIYQIFQRS